MKCLCVGDIHGHRDSTAVDHVRLFRAARWSYRVHEQILRLLRATGADVKLERTSAYGTSATSIRPSADANSTATCGC